MTDPLRSIARITAPLAVPLAGRRLIPFWAIVEHRGRSSGRVYRTPVAVARTADGFMIPIPFGEGTQWVKNVLAAGGCRLRCVGKEIDLVGPVEVGGAEGMAAFNRVERGLMGPAGIHRFLRLATAERERARP